MLDKKRNFIDPATFFLVAGLLVGILYCIVVPYGAGFDEERHLVRIYYMSQGHMMPNFPDPTIHEDVFDLSYQRRLVQTPAFDMFESENFLRRFSTFDKLRYFQKTQSIYSPIIFLPQALVGRLLWWKYDFPILPTIILQKIAGLLIYIAGAYAAIRVLPYGKWIFTALALLPSALYQASTLNADGFTAAVSFAFIGWVIAVYVDEASGIRPRSIWILVILSILLGFAKPGAIILLPLLLVFIKHPFPSKKWIVILGAGVLLAVVANIGWWMIASEGTVFSGEGEQSITQQSGTILSDPLGFIKPLLQGMILTFPNQIQGWVAAYGYWAGTVPGPVYFFSAIFLLAALLAEPRVVQLSKGTRIFLVGVFCFSSAAIYTIAFAPNYVTGGVLALAKHGRYYIPFAPLFFLGIVGSFAVRENVQRLMNLTVIVSFLLLTIGYLFGIYTTYYTYCGYDAYVGAECTLPIYKNLEKEAAMTGLNNGEYLTQTFTNQCGQLEAVQVYVRSIPESLDGSLKFSLLDGDQNILASQEFRADEVPVEDYLTLSVQLPRDYENKNFEIQLDASNLSPLDKFRFAVAPGDYYPGQLTSNGEALRGDLLIHYTCSSP